MSTRVPSAVSSLTLRLRAAPFSHSLITRTHSRKRLTHAYRGWEARHRRYSSTRYIASLLAIPSPSLPGRASILYIAHASRQNTHTHTHTYPRGYRGPQPVAFLLQPRETATFERTKNKDLAAPAFPRRDARQ